MAVFYFDADVKPEFRLLVQARGHNVVTTQERHQLDATDAEQLVTATLLGRILITHNGKHFRVLCEAWQVWRRVWDLAPADHAGVIAIPQQTLLPYVEGASEIDRLLGRNGSIWNQVWFFDLRSSAWVRQV